MDKFDVDGDLVRKLAGLLEETGLGEIEFETESCRIRVARPGAGPASGAIPVAAAPAPAVEAAPPPVAEAAASNDSRSVTSPMVGTIYLSPAPDEAPYVGVGDSVTAGQTLMLVEAMKTFNEIKAPKAGRIIELLVESGQPVEFGEVLAIVG